MSSLIGEEVNNTTNNNNNNYGNHDDYHDSTTTDTNPCTLVRTSCMEYVQTDLCQSYVTINHDAIILLAKDILQLLHTNTNSETNNNNNTTKKTNELVEWDEEQWHYNCNEINTTTGVNTTQWSKAIRIERILLYILALDAINFSFWTTTTSGTATTTTTATTDTEQQQYEKKFEYVDLATSLRNMACSDHIYQQQLIDNDNNNLQNQNHDKRNSTNSIQNQLIVSSEYIFTPQNLQSMTVERMKQLFQTYGDNSIVPPNINIRCCIWNEIGTILLQHSKDGTITSLLGLNDDTTIISTTSKPSAPELVRTVINYFPNFRDDTIQHRINNGDIEQQQQQQQELSVSLRTSQPSSSSQPILYFYKRAQIFVGDIHASLKGNHLLSIFSDSSTTLLLDDNTDTSYDIFQHIDDITTFADYRVPQLLRHYNVLVYNPITLAPMIDNYTELPMYSYEEYAIRTSTVAAVELLVQEIKYQQQHIAGGNETNRQQQQQHWNAMQVDWYLWQVGEKLENENQLLPHHRVRTTFY